jgi:hypothetical protein
MTFGLAPPKNIKNLFGNCVVIWTMWNTRNDFIFNKKNSFIFAGYPYDRPMDLYLVLSPTRGAKECNRLEPVAWVYSTGAAGGCIK